MRQKGKPKAKTKLIASSNCDIDQQVVGDGEQQMVTPLISISHAPAGPSNPLTAGRIAGETNPINQQEVQTPPTRGNKRETVMLFDGQSAHRETVLEPSGERFGQLKRLLQWHKTNTGIRLVSESYIKLMARNSLYQFHMGSFAFSVMNMIFLLTFNCCTQLLAPVDHLIEKELNGTLTSSNQNNNLTAVNCDNNPAYNRAPSLQDLRHLVWLLLISLLLVTAVQLVVIVLECYVELRFRRRGQQPQPQQHHLADLRQDTNTSNQSHHDKFSDLSERIAGRLLDPLAVSSSYTLLILPTLMFHFNQSSWVCPGKRPSLPLTPISITSYLLISISSWPTLICSNSRLLRCTNFLVLLVLGLIVEQKHGDQHYLVYFVWFISLILGAMRYKLFIGTHLAETFKRANQLIEAKVSLEQQRQQQETLLLSVLPAYVAEQVKRNMLKKMDTVKEPLAGVDLLDGQIESLQASQLGSNASGASPQIGSHPPATPLQSLRSLTLPANCDGPPLAPRDQQQHQVVVTSIPKRRSFAARLKLGSSFANPPNRSTATASLTPTSEQSQPTEQPPGAGPANLNSNQLNLTPQIVGHKSHQSRRGFNELYIRTYNNVSLLYGDIVGFTRLCSQLSSSQLVLVLNNLFSYFDYLAEQHKIMRIKILGDCYYGVSGIPEFAVLGAKSSSSSRHHHFSGHNGQLHKPIGGDNHAINCVNMGLDMIHYIKCLNIERTSQLGPNDVGGQTDQLPANFELNMRIGIHTGHIHSGVIGLKKWQFDVWSNDVSIAMHCESSGVAGRVQVTEATVQHLRNAFTIEQATRSSRDTFLADRSIRTFLILDRVKLPDRPLINNHLFGRAGEQTPTGGSKQEFSDNNQRHFKRAQAYSFAPSEIQAMDQGRIREATIGTIRQTLLAGELAGSGGGIASGGGFSGGGSGAPLALSGPARLDHNDMRWWTLEFKDSILNGQFNARLISASHHLGQLCLLFLLLIVMMPILNYKLIDWSSHDDEQEDGTRLLTVANLLLALPLIVVALLPKSRSVTKNILRRRRSTLTDGASSRSSPIHWIRAADSATLGDENELVSREHNKWVTCFNLKRLNKFCSKLKPSKWHFGKRQASNLLGSYLVTLTLILFTVLQYNLIRRASCDQLHQNQLQQKPTETNSQRVKQLHQLTVFSLLAALDLSSSLLPFRLRAAFLVAIATIQLLILCATANAMRRRQGQSSLFQQILPASNLMGALCGGQFNRTNSGQADAGLRLTTRDIGQHLLDWSGDALLLILSLWSWAFQRQLEYSQRANFLWRNRLNVDHEELEYISGINKVLLENILPSHVVQHYLDQPTTNDNEQPATTTMARENASETSTVEQRDRKASRVLVAGGNQLMGVAMSPTQVRSLPEFHQLNNGGEQSRLTAIRQTVGHELYHEQHESVAVMFASIPHFYEFYDESDISKQGLGCIALLNEIICDFDKLLLKNKFSRIEKIKTIGSTYMAAAGLRPSCPVGVSSARNSNASQISQLNAGQTPNRDCDGQQQQQVVGSANCLSTTTDQHQTAPNCATPDRRLVLSQQKMNLICMIQFATSLMSALNGINKQSFQLFKLRVGVNTGPVVAGIIGAQRPFYDIWGDCVNIASRMESLGEVGRIQVEERTAKLLSECLCPETYAIERRGPIDVKGKGGMVTYFVDKRQQSQSPQPPQPSLQPLQQHQQQQQRHELAD